MTVQFDDERTIEDASPVRGPATSVGRDSTSPLVDAGEVIPGLTRDLLGHARVVGAAPDIGPIERL